MKEGFKLGTIAWTIFRRGAFLYVLAVVCCFGACTKSTVPSAAQILASAQTMGTAKADSVKAYEDLLRTAIRKAETEADWVTCANASLLLAAQLQWTDEQEALQLALNAQSMIRHHGSVTVGLKPRVSLTLAGLYEQMGDVAHARTLYQECLSDSASRQIAISRLANLSLAEGDANEALRLARQLDTASADSTDIDTRVILANCYLQCDSLPQARALYEELRRLPNEKMQYIAERHLAEISILERDLEGLPDLLDSAFTSAEAVFFEALQQKDVYFHATLEQERKAEHMAYRQKLAMWTLLGVCIVAALVVAFLVMLNKHRRAIHLQRLQTEQRERELMAERLVQQGEKIQLLQHFILEKNEVLRRLREEGDDKKQLSPHEWLDVEQLLDSTTGGFVTRLRALHPEFQEEDIQLCMLTRMKLSNQVIASIYLITVSAVKHRKLKLKKSGFGEKDPERPLDEVLSNI